MTFHRRSDFKRLVHIFLKRNQNLANRATGQILGTVTFLSVCGSLFANTAVKLIMPLLPAETSLAAATDIITGTHSLAFQDLDPEVSRQVVSKIAQSMQNVWSFNLAGSALSFVLSLFLKVWSPVASISSYWQWLATKTKYGRNVKAHVSKPKAEFDGRRWCSGL